MKSLLSYFFRGVVIRFFSCTPTSRSSETTRSAFMEYCQRKAEVLRVMNSTIDESIESHIMGFMAGESLKKGITMAVRMLQPAA